MKPKLTTIRTDDDISSGLKKLLTQDPRLITISEIAGRLPLRLQDPGFAGLARIIIGQHVSTASASAIHGRFVNEITPITPHNFLEARPDAWIEIGLTRAKQATIKNLAEQIISGELDLEALIKLPAQEAIKNLTALKGIGPWTAEVYLLFSAGHPDIFAAGDLAVREAVRQAFEMEERPSEKELREIAKLWTPYRGIATRLFWTYYEKKKRIKDAML